MPRDRRGLVEQALVAHGWEHVTFDPYDQRYYRTWMHELPPLRHRDRKTVVDVHHTILPRSGGLRPDPRLLLEAARPVARPGPRVLAPADMVLHSAAHLFQDGDFQGGLRDLLDLDGLLRHFAGADAAFWEHLAARASQLGLDRPLFYALRFTARLLGTPLPGVGSVAAAGRPPAPGLAMMDRLITLALVPDDPERRRPAAGLARWLLYVRSHWVRMPPLLLARHLLRKSLRRGPVRA